MGHATFTPKQKNWRWYKDDGASPTEALGDEITKPTLPDNTSKIRLRVNLKETAGASANNQTITLEYSTNDADFTAMGAANHWDYADGQATEGDTLSVLKLGDTDTKAIYEEGGGGNYSYPSGNEAAEWDVCVVPTGNVSSNTTYYFRCSLEGTEVPLDTDETHPQVLTATASQSVTAEPSEQVLTSSLPSPTVTAQRQVEVTPSAQAVTSSLPAPIVTAEINVEIAGSVVTITSSLPSLTVTAQRQVEKTPSVQVVSASLPAPTITAQRQVEVSPNVQTVTSSLSAPTVITGLDVEVSATVVTATASLPAPTVTTQKQIEVTPSAQTVTPSLPSPVVTAQRQVLVAVNAQAVTFSLPSPKITIGTDALASPSVVDLIFGLETPTISTLPVGVNPLMGYDDLYLNLHI